MDGMWLGHTVVMISAESEYDYRGFICLETAKDVLDRLVDRGWAEIDDSEGTAQYPYIRVTEQGVELFEANKEYWTSEWRRLKEIEEQQIKDGLIDKDHQLSKIGWKHGQTHRDDAGTAERV